MRLENKVALITGGYGGMGRASAKLFAKEGASVVIAGRNLDRGNALAKEINDTGGKALLVNLDVTDQQQWEDAVEQTREKFGALHILMNIVGTNELIMLPKVDLEAWNKVFEINVNSVVIGIQACAPLMKESGGGSIVNIGSVAGITGNFGTAYSSSKWALEGLSRSAAYILADWSIHCNVIQPGFIETDMTQVLLGGTFWPVSDMPAYLQPFAYAMPIYYANVALRDVMLKKWGLAEIWPNLAILVGIGIVLVILSALMMRREVA